MQAHRKAWMQANGAIPTGMYVLHRCDTPACCNPAHLFLGTHFDNDVDRCAKGRTARGELSGRAKLTAVEVDEIRRQVALGESTMGAIAKAFGVSKSQVSRIGAGLRWSPKILPGHQQGRTVLEVLGPREGTEG